MGNFKNTNKVSIVLATYNGENFLSETLRSVLNQSYRNFEFIIVDDGSNDSSKKIIRFYEKNDKRIRFFSLKHKGPTFALNFGASKVSSKWIARIDQDDVWEKNKLRKQIQFLEENKKIILLGTGCREIDIYNNVIGYYCYPTSDFLLKFNLKRYKRFFPHSSAIYRTSVFRKIGGYNNLFFMADDWNLWTEFAKRGLISSIDLPLVSVRKHNSQRSFFDFGKLQINHAIASSALLFTFMRNVKANDYFINWINSELEKCGYYQKKINFKKIKESYLSEKNFFKKFFIISQYLMNDYSNFYIFFEKFFGSSLPHKLAKRWINS